jgi:hypothetical protein
MNAELPKLHFATVWWFIGGLMLGTVVVLIDAFVREASNGLLGNAQLQLPALGFDCPT